MQEQRVFPLNRFQEISERPEDFRLIERIPLNRNLVEKRLPLKLTNAIEGERVHQVVFLDTETTGIEHGFDKIIELGLVKATYSFDRRILLSIDKVFDGFEDPGRKIPQEIVELTGITDEIVAGKSLDQDRVAQMLLGRPLVVAHNAKFDRPFFDERFPSLGNLSWACSYSGINWDLLGSNGRKLEYLNLMRGWFYEAHRADDDCLALAWLMHIEPEAFSMLIEEALRKEYQVFAWGSPYSAKDILKGMGYRFDGKMKVWYKNFVQEAEAKMQISVLSQHYDASQTEVRPSTAVTRFKLN